MTPPTVAILSPKDGTGYDLDEVVIRYEAKTADGKAPEIMVSIDNEPYDMTAKGVRRVGDELRLKLPSKEGVRRIQLIAKDSRGLNSEPVYLTLRYTGEQLKPALHLLAVGWDNTTTRTSPTSHMRPKMRRISPGSGRSQPGGYRKTRNRFC